MAIKDPENSTYTVELNEIFSSDGLNYHLEKYLPKIEIIRSHISDNKDTTLLDIGVGYGGFLKILEDELSIRTFGLDPYEKSIEISLQNCNADIRKGQIEDKIWPFDFKFDIITCFDVIEHLEDPDVFFKHVKKYIKEDGIIIATTPLKSIAYNMRSIPIIGIPDTNPTHINVHPPSYWNKLAIQNQFEISKNWRGEHLTHIKWIPGLLKRIAKLCNLDHRNIPFVNTFEQAYNMVLKPIQND